MSLRRSHPDVFLSKSDGSGKEIVLESEKAVTDWSPDGRVLLFRANDATTNLELWTVPVGGDGQPVPFRRASYGVSHGQVSPDGSAEIGEETAPPLTLALNWAGEEKKK